MSHNFRFRWNDHVPHISQNFNFLRSEELYCDTTLVSDDGYVIKAHGAVLSATSRYFERVLAEVSSEQHPIIVLQGANFTELSFLLDYIYQGETQIDHNLIKSVLDVAEALEVKGLSKLKNNLSMKKLLAPSPYSSQSLLSPGLETSYSPAPSYNESSPIPASSPPNLKIDEAISECETTDLLLDRATAPTSRFKSPDEEKTDFETSSIKLKHHNTTSSFTDYLDQNLGIDLTVSRSNVEEEKHFDSIKEQRKRKKEIEESVPIKKKKFFTKSDSPEVDYEFGQCCGAFSHEEIKISESTRTKSAQYSNKRIDAVTTPEVVLDQTEGPIRPMKQNPFSLTADISLEKTAVTKEGGSKHSDLYTIFNQRKPGDGGTEESTPSDPLWTETASLHKFPRPIRIRSVTSEPFWIPPPSPSAGLEYSNFVNINTGEKKYWYGSDQPGSKIYSNEAPYILDKANEKIKRPKVKRPPSQFTLFMKDMYEKHREQGLYQGMSASETQKIIAQEWKDATPEQRRRYAHLATVFHDEFKKANPEYHQGEQSSRLREYRRKKAEIKSMFLIKPEMSQSSTIEPSDH